jgi:hypothetical protein
MIIIGIQTIASRSLPILAMYRDETAYLHAPAALHFWESPPNTHSVGGWLSPTAGLSPRWELNFNSSVYGSMTITLTTNIRILLKMMINKFFTYHPCSVLLPPAIVRLGTVAWHSLEFRANMNITAQLRTEVVTWGKSEFNAKFVFSLVWAFLSSYFITTSFASLVKWRTSSKTDITQFQCGYSFSNDFPSLWHWQPNTSNSNLFFFLFCQ